MRMLAVNTLSMSPSSWNPPIPLTPMAVPSNQTATDSRNYAQMRLRPAVSVHLVLTGPTVQIRADLVFPVVHCSRA